MIILFQCYKLYILLTGTSCLSSVERFDPLISAWFSVPSLEIKRRYCRLASMHGSLYVVGGYDGANYLASVERYDPRVSAFPFV